MTSPSILERLERFVVLRRPDPSQFRPSAGMTIVLLCVILAFGVFAAYAVLGDGSLRGSLPGWGWLAVVLAVAADSTGFLLHARGKSSGRVLRVFARLSFLPLAVVLSLVSAYLDFGLYGGVVGVGLLLIAANPIWIVARYSGPLRGRRLR